MSSEEKPDAPVTSSSVDSSSAPIASSSVASSTPEPKAVVDKIADAAPRADPRDITKRDALNGLKNVDRTILRLNKYVLHTIDLS